MSKATMGEQLEKLGKIVDGLIEQTSKAVAFTSEALDAHSRRLEAVEKEAARLNDKIDELAGVVFDVEGE